MKKSAPNELKDRIVPPFRKSCSCCVFFVWNPAISDYISYRREEDRGGLARRLFSHV